jgi:acyl-CoA thioesterase FadM
LTLDEKGVAVGRFDCASLYEGYTGFLHGGITAAVLDGAMTNCLFLHGCAAVTAKMTVRYHYPVLLGKPAQVRAWIAEMGPPVFCLQAQMVQDGLVKASARASFMLPKPHPRSRKAIPA